MSDPRQMMGPPAGGPSPFQKNLSALNPQEATLMAASGKFSPDMTVRDYLSQMGIDVEGPVSQLLDFAQKQVANKDMGMKMQNIAADTALQAGGQPPTRPGVKPMVKPPGQPSPAGLEGLMNRLGGR